MSDRISEIKANNKTAAAVAVVLRDLDDIRGQRTVRSNAADIIDECNKDSFYLLGEIERLTVERDHLKYRAEKTREYLVRLQEALELFSAGKTAAGIIKSATLLALIDGETVQI